MKILYSDDKPFKLQSHITHSNNCEIHSYEPSLFLAGPSPRSPDVKSWRNEAVEILQKVGYTGTVCVPERKGGLLPLKPGEVTEAYMDQTEWEYTCLQECLNIVFWVPRKMGEFNALTTNVEFGWWLAKKPHEVCYGRPDNADSIRYLDWLFNKVTKKKPENTLENTLVRAVDMLCDVCDPFTDDEFYKIHKLKFDDKGDLK